MNYDVAVTLLTVAVAVRVFAADVRTLLRRLLGAGVRVGAAHLASEMRPPETDVDPRHAGGGQ